MLENVSNEIQAYFTNQTKNSSKEVVPIPQKRLLTLEEAAQYTGLGVNKIREISNDEHCNFVLWNGAKRMLKRTKLEEYLDSAYSI